VKVAIVHYWLVGMRGGERVVERLLRLYPNADIFTHVYDPSRVSETIRAAKVHTTFIQKLPGAVRHYQKYLPLMPQALEALDLSAYDLVISSEAGPAKGIITRPDATHVCYCHSPMRYLWDQAPIYARSSGLLARLGMSLFSHHLRIWDVTTALRVDRFIANSAFVSQRINKYYRRSADIVFPPVDVDAFQIRSKIEPHYLWLGQLTAYKRPEIAVEAFNALGLPLMVVGEGELAPRLRAMAKTNITFRDPVSFTELKEIYATARGLIFTAEEDFGIVPVEMMASGRPVLAYRRGGALDTVVEGISGQFFDEQSVACLIDAVKNFEGWLQDFSPEAAKNTTERFSPEKFDAAVLEVINRARSDSPGASKMTRPERNTQARDSTPQIATIK
jgi:glycosyltransferase involved in cell wall biosynthesis